jgi:hypothetical protein
MEEEIRPVDLPIRDFHGIRLSTVRTRRLDATVDVERAENAARIPGTVGVPPATPRMDPVRGRHSRERIGHPELVRRRVEHEGVSLMQPTPSCSHVGLVSELSGSRRATELDEGCICPVSEVQEIGVDPLTLPLRCAHGNGVPAAFEAGFSAVASVQVPESREWSVGKR